MFTTRVVTTQQKVWHVGLVIIPKRRGVGLHERFRRRKPKNPERNRWVEFIDFPFDFADELWWLVALVALAGFMVLVGWPTVLILLDLAWLGGVVVGAIFSFGLLRRPITIRAYSADTVYTRRQSGFRAALVRKNSIAQQLSAGKAPKDIS